MFGLLVLLSLSTGLAFFVQWVPFVGTALGFFSMLLALGIVTSILSILLGTVYFRASYALEGEISRGRRDMLLLVAILVLALSLFAQAWFNFIGALLIVVGLLFARVGPAYDRQVEPFERG